MSMKLTFALHVHHEGPVIELLTEPIENRINYINANKSSGEIETRLRLLRELTEEEVEQLPPAWVEAYRVYREAYRVWGEAYRAYGEAYRVYGEAGRAWEEAYRVWGEADRAYWEADWVWVKAYRVYAPQLEALHTRICLPDCPWDGKTIFPHKMHPRGV